MDLQTQIIIVLVAVILILIWLYRRKIYHFSGLQESYRDLTFKKQSQSTRYGKMTEQFLPFINNYPYDEHQFRFIGSPIDGIQFTDDGIILVEFKSANSRLTPGQKNIKKMVDEKKVYFEEYRVGDKM